MISVIFVKNPFDTSQNKTYKVPFAPGNTVRIYVEPYMSYYPDTEFHVSINGHTLEKYEVTLLCPADKDHIVIMPVVGKSLGSLLGTIAMMALSAYIAGPSFLPGMSGWSKALVQGLAMYVGGRIINAILPPPKQNLNSSTTSPTYGWDGAKPIAATGTPIGRTFGTVKPSPVVLARHVTTDGDKQYLNILYGAGEGPIDSIDNITIDGNPIANYKDVQVDIRLGTNEQEPIANFGDTFADQSLNYELSSTAWATQQTEGNAGSGLEITFALPYGLYHTKDDGSLENATVKVKAQYRVVGNTMWTDWPLIDDGTTDPFEGRTGMARMILALWGSSGKLTLSKYNGAITAAKNTAVYRVYRIDGLDPAQYEVRCQCYYKQGTDTRYSTRVYWSQLSHIIYGDFARPNKVLIGIKALATDQLSGSDPNVGWTQTRSKVNVWNPSINQYEQKPATNPYWACYDMIHNCKYLKNINTGQYEYVVEGNPISRIDYPTFLENANYSAELIDGDPRFELSLYLDAEISFWDALARIAVVGRGVVIPKGTKYSCICDKPAIPTQLFTMGNITEKSFKGKFQSVKDRSQCIEVDFYNELKDYKQDLAIYYGDEYNTTTQIPNPTKVTRYGISKYKYAYREAIFLYKGNKYLKRTVDWEADIDAIACKPGDVVLLAHDVPKWGAASGRIVAATSTTVTLDQPVPSLETGKTYAVEIRLKTDERVNRIVTSVSQETNTLTVVEPFETIPERYDIFSFGESYKVTKPFKVINIVKSKDLQCKLSGVEYIEDMYSDVVDIPIINYSSYDNRLIEVDDLSLGQETYKQKDGTIVSVIHCSWTIPRGKFIKDYTIYFSKNNGDSWQLWDSSIQNNTTILGIQSLETYLVKVCTRNEVGIVSRGVISEPIYITGKDEPPPDIETLFVEKMSTGYYRLTFTLSNVPIDLAGYQFRYNIGSSTFWDNAIPMHDGLIVSSPFEANILLSGTFTIVGKAIDNSGNASNNVASVIIGLGDTIVNNIIFEKDFKIEGFTGNKTNCSVSDDILVANDNGDLFYPTDKNAPIYTATNDLFYKANWLSMIYEDTFIPDDKGELSFEFKADGNAQIFYRQRYPYQFYSSDNELMFPDDDRLMYIRGPYIPYGGKVLTGGNSIHDIRVEISAGTMQGMIKELKAIVDVQDEYEVLNDIVISSAGIRLPITKTYRQIKNVNITIQDNSGASALTFRLSDKSNLGPFITLYDKNNIAVSGIVDAQIQGIKG